MLLYCVHVVSSRALQECSWGFVQYLPNTSLSEENAVPGFDAVQKDKCASFNLVPPASKEKSTFTYVHNISLMTYLMEIKQEEFQPKAWL